MNVLRASSIANFASVSLRKNRIRKPSTGNLYTLCQNAIVMVNFFGDFAKVFHKQVIRYNCTCITPPHTHTHPHPPHTPPTHHTETS